MEHLGIWRSADLVERIICLSLAVMLGYTFFVLTRLLLHHHRCHYELCNLIPDFGTDDLRNGKQLISELSHGIAVLKGISTAAPFLGLAGTSYGILCALWFPYSGSPDRYFRLLFTRFAFAMTTTLAGIVVALTATVCYYLLRKRIESLSSTLLLSHNSARSTVPSFRFAHSLPLKQRFAGLPPWRCWRRRRSLPS